MSRRLASPLLLTLPSGLVYALVLLLPLIGVAVLSLQGFDFDKGILPRWNLANYADLATDSLFREVLERTFRLSLVTTAICLLIGVPEAWIVHRMAPRWRGLMLLVVVGPLLVSVVVRTFGWMVLLGTNGLVNDALVAIGIPGAPFRLMFTELAIVIGLVHVMVPLVVLSVWASLGRLDPALARAAESLGAGRLTTFRRVILPNIMPGVLGGALMVFCLSASAFATPAMLGGKRLRVVASMAYNEFLNTLNWPLGAAIAVLLLIAILLCTLLWTRLVERRALRRLGVGA
ncbi:ABC transporter permease protein [Roseomonas mucosa]|uniref:ABC transporter permease n=1 Tax=Roseomonas mucosa TaxID=207340 RepID=A0A1S8D6I5_9PROT|nr:MULTISPECIES: ABC transporter permease [Roseomonas]MBS5903130.1 ABC transporter permease [Acetobacteraceae bacterium]MDT8263074.1 ABC transporter permease [Roseomonas sp. DSM 102946]ATR21837.1 ABC transporter permease [Roseomonas sp. FDAARGOS_362]AWV21426.1 ABC transporter permease protein [Roseomonas mucosa]MCG7350820.1 ABC transporter permease [Roseomonas mucosa]